MEKSYPRLLDPSYDSLETVDKYHFFINLITDTIKKSTPTPKTVNIK